MLMLQQLRSVWSFVLYVCLCGGWRRRAHRKGCSRKRYTVLLAALRGGVALVRACVAACSSGLMHAAIAYLNHVSTASAALCLRHMTLSAIILFKCQQQQGDTEDIAAAASSWSCNVHAVDVDVATSNPAVGPSILPVFSAC
jgi:hypothetical protein